MKVKNFGGWILQKGTGETITWKAERVRVVTIIKKRRWRKKVRQFFWRKNRVTPSVATPGDSNSCDAIVYPTHFTDFTDYATVFWVIVLIIVAVFLSLFCWCSEVLASVQCSYIISYRIASQVTVIGSLVDHTWCSMLSATCQSQSRTKLWSSERMMSSSAEQKSPEFGGTSTSLCRLSFTGPPE